MIPYIILQIVENSSVREESTLTNVFWLSLYQEQPPASKTWQ